MHVYIVWIDVCICYKTPWGIVERLFLQHICIVSPHKLLHRVGASGNCILALTTLHKKKINKQHITSKL